MTDARTRRTAKFRGGRVLRAGVVVIGAAAVAALTLAAHAGGERCAAAMKAARASASVLSPAPLGPPMVCHEVLIKDAKSLPWEGGRGGGIPNYKADTLPADTVALLIKERGTLVRMETLRRAAVYLSYQDRAMAEHLAWELIGRRSDWLMFGESSGKLDPAAWFDVAYFVGCLNQVGMSDGFKLGESNGIPGYLYMEKAFEQAKKIDLSADRLAEMHFGAAVMTHPAMRNAEYNYVPGTRKDIYDDHVLAALKGTQGNELLELNLAAHLKNFGGSIEDVRKVAAGK